MSYLGARCLGAAVGLLVDRFVGEPPNAAHPVVWFGRAMQRTEAALWADRRAAGIGYAAIGTGLGAVAGRLGRSTATVVAITVAGRQLRSTAERIGQAADAGDIERARAELPALVGRDPSELDAPGIAAAVIESLAENSVDAVIAPVFWAVVAGAPGAAIYRAINTMDAMVGHRNTRYRNFGWAAARIDDAANYLPRPDIRRSRCRTNAAKSRRDTGGCATRRAKSPVPQRGGGRNRGRRRPRPRTWRTPPVRLRFRRSSNTGGGASP